MILPKQGLRHAKQLSPTGLIIYSKLSDGGFDEKLTGVFLNLLALKSITQEVKGNLLQDQIDVNEVFNFLDSDEQGKVELDDFCRLFDQNSVGLEEIEKKLELFIQNINLTDSQDQSIFFKDFYMFFNL